MGDVQAVSSLLDLALSAFLSGVVLRVFMYYKESQEARIKEQRELQEARIKDQKDNQDILIAVIMRGDNPTSLPSESTAPNRNFPLRSGGD